MPTTQERISELVNTILQETDFFLIEVQIKGGKTPKIFIFIDGIERNVNLDECAEISNELGFLIDAHEIFTDSYHLNVSSPGLSRQLTDWRQYPKNKGRKVKVRFENDEQEEKTVEGTLKEVLEDKVIIKKQDERLILPFDQVKETKVVPSLKKD